jgi:hypothetical protein
VGVRRYDKSGFRRGVQNKEGLSPMSYTLMELGVGEDGSVRSTKMWLDTNWGVPKAPDSTGVPLNPGPSVLPLLLEGGPGSSKMLTLEPLGRLDVTMKTPS